jgi:MFS family permease
MRLRLPDGELRAIFRPRSVAERNVRNVLIDGIGVGIVTGVGTFLAVFLARLGASSLLVGLITSLPALTGALLAVPIGRFLERQRRIVPWYSGMRVWVLWSYAIFGLLPFFLPLNLVPWAVVIIWAIVTIPNTFMNVSFTVVMGAVAGPRRRFFLMSLRWSSLGAMTAITVAIVGQILTRIAFPLNYQLVFIGSFFGGLLSFLFSRSIELPDRIVDLSAPAEKRARRSIAQRFDDLRAQLRSAPPAFLRFAGSAFVFRAGVAMLIPLLPLYYVREVGADDAAIGLIATVGSGVLVVAYTIWSLLTRKLGIGRALLLSSFGMAVYPFAVAATDSVLLLAIFAGLVGFFAAGNELVHFDLVLSTVPPERQASYIGLYQTLQNAALFLMPLLGTLLADTAGLFIALITAGVLRLAGSLMYVALGVGAPTVETTS